MHHPVQLRKDRSSYFSRLSEDLVRWYLPLFFRGYINSSTWLAPLEKIQTISLGIYTFIDGITDLTPLGAEESLQLNFTNYQQQTLIWTVDDLRIKDQSSLLPQLGQQMANGMILQNRWNYSADLKALIGDHWKTLIPHCGPCEARAGVDGLLFLHQTVTAKVYLFDRQGELLFTQTSPRPLLNYRWVGRRILFCAEPVQWWNLETNEVTASLGSPLEDATYETDQQARMIQVRKRTIEVIDLQTNQIVNSLFAPYLPGNRQLVIHFSARGTIYLHEPETGELHLYRGSA